MLKRTVFFIGLFMSLLLVLGAQVIRAQSDTYVSADQNKRGELVKTYGAQIQAYQDTYRRYSLAYTQYRQLQTIASLGELVDLSRETMRRRGEVILTYLDILYLELQLVSDEQSASKQTLLKGLEQLHYDFLLQQNLIANSQDYKALNTRAEAFVDLIWTLDYYSLKTKAYVYSSKVQDFYLETQSYAKQIEEKYQQNPESNSKAVERQRAMDQIADSFAKLESLRQAVDKEEAEDEIDQGWYTQYLSKLQAVQNQLLLVLAYLKEASRL